MPLLAKGGLLAAAEFAPAGHLAASTANLHMRR